MHPFIVEQQEAMGRAIASPEFRNRVRAHVSKRCSKTADIENAVSEIVTGFAKAAFKLPGGESYMESFRNEEGGWKEYDSRGNRIVDCEQLLNYAMLRNASSKAVRKEQKQASRYTSCDPQDLPVIQPEDTETAKLDYQVFRLLHAQHCRKDLSVSIADLFCDGDIQVVEAGRMDILEFISAFEAISDADIDAIQRRVRENALRYGRPVDSVEDTEKEAARRREAARKASGRAKADIRCTLAKYLSSLL